MAGAPWNALCERKGDRQRTEIRINDNDVGQLAHLEMDEGDPLAAV